MQRRQRHAVVSVIILHLFRHARRFNQYGKAGALPRRAAHADIAAHCLRQPTRYRQSNAGAGRRFAAVLIFHLIVHGEDLVLLLLRNSLPGVLHLKAQRLVLLIGDAHYDLPMLGKLHCVADEVPQNLTQARAVGANLMRQRQVRCHNELKSLRLRQQSGEVLQIREEAGEVERLVIQLHLAALNLVHLNDVVEDIAERNSGNVDGFKVLQLLLIEIGIKQNTAQADNAVKRRTQLVADS